jgi:hypothetical protein
MIGRDVVTVFQSEGNLAGRPDLALLVASIGNLMSLGEATKSRFWSV